MELKRFVIILLIVVAVAFVIVSRCTLSSAQPDRYSRTGRVPYDPVTMNYNITPDQAKQAARDWAGDQTLQLEVTAVDTPNPPYSKFPEYVLTTADGNQTFEVCTSTAEIREWRNKTRMSSYIEKLDQTGDVSATLPQSELSGLRTTFLSVRYPGWSSLNMQPVVPHSDQYAQRLSNGVINRLRSVTCTVDEWTGEVCLYRAPAAEDSPIPVQYSVQLMQAEQNALAHVLNTGWEEGPEEGVLDFASAFVYRTPFVQVTLEKDGTAVLVWTVTVISHLTNPTFDEADYDDYIKDYTLNHRGFKSIMDGLKCWFVDVDANTGAVVLCAYDSQHTYDFPVSVAAPTFSPDAGTYTGAQIVTMNCSEPGSAIRYTTDGTKPTPTSTLYTAPVTISSSKTLKARSFKVNLRSSEVKSATYTIQ